MTKQANNCLDEATRDYLMLCEDIVADFFGALDTSDSTEQGGMGSQQEMAVADLRDLDLDELIGGLRQADEVLEGFWHIAAATSPVLMVVASDARMRTRDALGRVERFCAHWQGRP